MTRKELIIEADNYRKAAGQTSDLALMIGLLRKAASRYRDAGRNGLANWCEKHMEQASKAQI